MKKVIKGLLFTALGFLVAGVLFLIIGKAGGGTVWADETVLENIENGLNRFHISIPLTGSGEITIDAGEIEYDDEYEVLTGDYIDESIAPDMVKKIEVEIGSGDLNIQEGTDKNSFILEKTGDGNFQYYLEEGTLHLKNKNIKSGKNGHFMLVIPSGAVLEEADIFIGGGRVEAGSITAEKLEMEVGAGEAALGEVYTEKFSAEIGAGSLIVEKLQTEKCETEVAMGSIIVNGGTITGNLDAQVSMGEIEFSLDDSYENHKYDIDCGMGEIIVESPAGKKTYGGISHSVELSGEGAEGSKYELECGMGSIFIKFRK